tara:strand:+ start:1383 stop:2447 length:1065 start_codon:yes stop_codon:yes gene_type:complete
MAINVNEVYKTVLLILNKEQRGYITPNEFNKTATQVQLEIFEKYFEDLNQNLRVRQDETEYADRVKNIDDRISIFKTQGTCTWNGTYNAFVLPTNVHRLGTVIYKDSIEIERVQKNDLLYLKLSPLTKPSTSFPVYSYEDRLATTPDPKLYVEPSTIQADVSVSYIRKPINPRFGYTVGSLGQYLYDSSDFIATGLPIIDNYLFSSLTTNFATSTSEPTKTVWNALTLASAGITYVGNGSGLKFDLTLAVDGTITGITTNTPGTGFAIGDTITFSADTFQAGGTPGAVDAVITLNAASLYNGSTFGSTQFEIDNVDQTETILNILKYSGIVIRDPQIVQQASQLAAAEDQNEKS